MINDELPYIKDRAIRKLVLRSAQGLRPVGDQGFRLIENGWAILL